MEERGDGVNRVTSLLSADDDVTLAHAGVLGVGVDGKRYRLARRHLGRGPGRTGEVMRRGGSERERARESVYEGKERARQCV